MHTWWKFSYNCNTIVFFVESNYCSAATSLNNRESNHDDDDEDDKDDDVDYEEELSDNFRPLQPLNGRIVTAFYDIGRVGFVVCRFILIKMFLSRH